MHGIVRRGGVLSERTWSQDWSHWQAVPDRQSIIKDGTEGADTLTSGAGSDLLSGLGGDDLLLGRAGDDTLDGGRGTDTMTGGTGNDVYYVDITGDVLIERAGGGIDTAVALVSFYVLADNIENLDGSMPGVYSKFLIGNDLANLITGSAGHDNLVGAAGSDTLRGGLGDDDYQVENAGDVIIEAWDAGWDTVRTDLMIYRLPTNVDGFYALGDQGQKAIGNWLDNLMMGGPGNETLSGGQGDDTLFGQLGNDVLIGGGGADWFDFATVYSDLQVAKITDFNSDAGDQIGLRQNSYSTFREFGLGHLDPSVFKSYSNPDELDETDRILYNEATGQLFYDRDGAGFFAAIQFAVLTTHPTLTADSFWVHL